MSEEWLEDDNAALKLEVNRLKQEVNSLSDFSQRIENHLTDPELYQVMVDEFLIHCRADRVVIIENNPSRESEIIIHHSACEPHVKPVSAPYLLEEYSVAYVDFLKSSIQEGGTSSIQWNEPVMIYPDIFISRAMTRHFRVEGEMGDWLICLQWVEGIPKWDKSVQGLFENMTQYAQAIVDQRQMRFQIEELQAQEQTLLKCMPVPIIVLDLLGNVTLWTGAAQEVLGLRLDEALGVPLVELFPTLKAIEQDIPKVIQSNERKIIGPIDLGGTKLNLVLFSLMEAGRGEVGVMLF